MFWEYCTKKKKNKRPGENGTCDSSLFTFGTSLIEVDEYVYWICNQTQKREDWQGKLLPTATLCTYLCCFSLLLNWTCLQTLMSSPSNWCFFKHAMGSVQQHSGASLSCWNGVQSKCLEGTCLFNLTNHNGKDKCVYPSKIYDIALPHQAHRYLCN